MEYSWAVIVNDLRLVSVGVKVFCVCVCVQTYQVLCDADSVKN